MAVTSALMVMTGTACFPKAGVAPGPLTADAIRSAQDKWPESTPESLEQGRQAFLASCDGCHSYPDLAHYPESDWPGIMEEMGDKSDLSAEQTNLVLRFVLVSRTAQAQGTSAGGASSASP